MNASAGLRWLGDNHLNLDEARAAVAHIENDARRAVKIVARIRTMIARTEGERTLTDLNYVVHDVLALVRGGLTSAGIRVTTQLQERLPLIRCDRIEMQQVMLNLLMNAKDAMARSPSSRLVSIYSTADVSGDVSISIEDRGVGLEAGSDQLFEAFFSTKPGGMGMGLSICRSIVENHGGRIWADSSPGGGAIFTFTIPAAAIAPQPALEPAQDGSA